MNTNASQRLLIRDMGASELLDYAKSLKSTDEKIWKLCISCYKQLTDRDLLEELKIANV